MSPSCAHYRSVFYTGGTYDENSGVTSFRDQMYVEHLRPLQSAKRYPLILVHGGGQTGTTWLTKPDGRQGWAEHFLHHGYEVYIIDQPNAGRSPIGEYNLSNARALRTMSTEYVEERFTAIEDGGRWPQARLHTQWFGSGKRGNPIFETYFASTGPWIQDTVQQEKALLAAGTELLDRVGPAIVLSHSQGSLAGWLWADARPLLVKGLIMIEPKGPPFREAVFGNALTRPWGLTSIPLHFHPQPPDHSPAPLSITTIPATSADEVDGYLQTTPARELLRLKDIPIMIETAEASYHATYDHWTFMFLKQAGCRRVEHLKLADIGIYGNGHLQMLEKKRDEIAEQLRKWIDKVSS